MSGRFVKGLGAWPAHAGRSKAARAGRVVLALLLGLALGGGALVPAAAAEATRSEAAASAASREEDASTAQEIGRGIGAMMKRATDALKDLAKGISEGFRSTPADAGKPEECQGEEARRGKCP